MPLVVIAMLHTVWSLRRDPRFVTLAVLTAAAIGSGTVFYSVVEGLRALDAFYLSVMTLTTVGYGDFAPETDAGKLFTIGYAFFGVGLLLTLITTLATRTSETRLPSFKERPAQADHDAVPQDHG